MTYAEWIETVVIDPRIVGGEPVFQGTRLPVRHIGALALNGKYGEIVLDYPYLTPTTIAYAAVYFKTELGGDSLYGGVLS